MSPALRQGFFWLYVIAIGFCEASFAYNGFDHGLLRWSQIGLSVLNLCLFAYLDNTPILRKAAIYVAAAVVWGGLGFSYRLLHYGLDDGDLALFSILVWVDLALNSIAAIVLLRDVLRKPSR
ncbi:MAG: hypothetical protein ACXU8O_02635 [Asticcacaulis sp.]